MNRIILYSYGRTTVHGPWRHNSLIIVNRLYFVHSGQAVIRSATGDYTLTQGNAYFISQCKEFRPVDSRHFDHTYFDFYSQRTPSPGICTKLDAREDTIGAFFRLIDSLLSEDENKKQHQAVEQLLSGFLLALENNGCHFSHLSNPLISRAVSLLHEEYATMSTARLAKELNVNESHLIRLFHSHIGLPPMKYLGALRVLRGKELLQEGYSVNEAAALCGYSSAGSFYKAVKSQFNQSPSQLKKQ